MLKETKLTVTVFIVFVKCSYFPSFQRNLFNNLCFQKYTNGLQNKEKKSSQMFRLETILSIIDSFNAYFDKDFV